MKPNISIWNVESLPKRKHILERTVLHSYFLFLSCFEGFGRASPPCVRSFLDARSCSLHSLMSLNFSSAACYISVKIAPESAAIWVTDGQRRAAEDLQQLVSVSGWRNSHSLSAVAGKRYLLFTALRNLAKLYMNFSLLSTPVLFI